MKFIYQKAKLNGFTILEVMIAVFVLTLGIVAVLEIFPLSIQTQKSAQMAAVASQLAQERIEEVIAKSYDDILCDDITIPPCEEEKARVSASSQSSFYRYWSKLKLNYVDPANDWATTTATTTGMKKIEVTVFWKSPLGITEKEINLATLISKR